MAKRRKAARPEDLLPLGRGATDTPKVKQVTPGLPGRPGVSRTGGATLAGVPPLPIASVGLDTVTNAGREGGGGAATSAKAVLGPGSSRPGTGLASSQKRSGKGY